MKPPNSARLRARLRRAMPRLAVAAALLWPLNLALARQPRLAGSLAGRVLDAAATAALLLVLAYYGRRAVLWLGDRLLWRVRRRLVVTYLFVGLTPILLMTLLGLISGFGVSAEAMARILAAQVELMTRQAAAGARALAEELERSPAEATDQRLEAWLAGRGRLLQASLPGARITLWRHRNQWSPGAGGAGVWRAVAASAGVQKDAVGRRGQGELLPAWLQEVPEWSGVAVLPGPGEGEEEASWISLRAVSHGKAGSAPFAVLVDVPLGGELVERLRQTTAMNIHPASPDSGRLVVRQESGEVVFEARLGGQTDGEGGPENAAQPGSQAAPETAGARASATPALLQGLHYLVVMPAADWQSGAVGQQIVCTFEWSWTTAIQQLLGGSVAGRLWQAVLAAVGVVFLGLELLAVFVAGWMTRAVTGTVGELHRGTQFVKRGDFSHRVSVRSRDQLGELADAFNDMSANILSLLDERVERERLEREVEIAAEVQARLFPRQAPRLASAEISAGCRAARGVAGDYYDYVEIAPSLVALALGDVSGKGISAALLMSNLQACLRAQAGMLAESWGAAASAARGSGERPGRATAAGTALVHADGAVARIAGAINEQLCHSTDLNRFATLFLGLFDDNACELRYTSAGHPPAILVDAGGAVQRLSSGGMIVGAFDGARYEEARAALEPGAALVIYSDGISEALNSEGQQYGEDALLRFAVAHRHLPAPDLQRALFAEIDSWTGAKERGDDQTLLILKARGPST